MMRRPWQALTAACLSTTKQISRPTLRGVVFDMDGTLTVPNLDFTAMYSRCECPADEDILQFLANLSPAEAKPKFDIIQEMEAEATRTMQLLPGAREVISWLGSHQIPTALVTRNTQLSAQALQEQLPSSFTAIITRDNSEFLPKPDPSAMLYIADQWNVDPSTMVMVGDSPANDIVFGNAVGSTTVLLDTGPLQKYTEAASGKPEETADIVVDKLYDLARELWLNFDIEGDLGTHSLPKYDPPGEPRSVTAKAAKEGRIDGLQSQDLDTIDETGNTPLIWAADAGHLNVVEHLLEKGVSLDVRGYLGATALCRAARRGHLQILKQLVQAGADLDIPNDKLQHPLHFAGYKEHPEIVQVLLDSGVNTLVLDHKGRVPALDTKNESIREMILTAMV